jgi:hypothetical protein
VGQLAESVQVTAQTPLLESENATLGQVVNNRQVTELPLLGRNSYALAMLVPGVRPSTGVNNLVVDQISTVSYAINGQRPNSNEFLLDGAPNSAAAQNQPVVNANPDTVQEFKVEPTTSPPNTAVRVAVYSTSSRSPAPMRCMAACSSSFAMTF